MHCQPLIMHENSLVSGFTDRTSKTQQIDGYKTIWRVLANNGGLLLKRRLFNATNYPPDFSELGSSKNNEALFELYCVCAGIAVLLGTIVVGTFCYRVFKGSRFSLEIRVELQIADSVWNYTYIYQGCTEYLATEDFFYY